MTSMGRTMVASLLIYQVNNFQEITILLMAAPPTISKLPALMATLFTSDALGRRQNHAVAAVIHIMWTQ